MKKNFAALCGMLVWALAAPARPATLERTYELPATRLTAMGNPGVTETALAAAQTNGLTVADLPSIGSGLARAGKDEFFGVTDRGPNGMVGKRRTFPLPSFTPTIVRFKLVGTNLMPTQWIPLKDSAGKLISGWSNLPGDERLHESGDATTALPLDENGVDPEGIRVLPDGKFLICEEYAPSVLVVAPNGEVLVRYTPQSKPLPQATYPVRNILPDIFAQRRMNKGFESLALSPDGRWAWAILQAPLGDEGQKHFKEGQIVRGLKLDLQQPLAAVVAGEFLLRTGSVTNYAATVKPAKISFGDADWLAPDQLLLVEHAKGAVRLVVADFRRATDIRKHPQVETLFFEDARTDLAREKIQLAATREVFTTRTGPKLESGKIEGLAILGRTEVALANDNDFGIGEAGLEKSFLWIIRLAAPLW